MGENGKGEPMYGFCEGKGRRCLGGKRTVYRYPDRPGGLLFCSRCWPHRRAILKVRHYQKEKEGGGRWEQWT